MLRPDGDDHHDDVALVLDVDRVMDPYEVLGVRADASTDEIRRAYLELARRHHPDHHLGSSAAQRADAERRMRDINDAWAALRDPARRPKAAEEPPRPFRPFSVDEDGVDPREAPDVPYRPSTPPTVTDRAATLAPVGLFVAALVVGGIGAVLRAASLLGLGVILFLLSCVGFLVLPLLALGRARRDEG